MTDQTPPLVQPPGDPVRRFFGGLLMAVGGLIAALCGLCSLLFVGTMMFDGALFREGDIFGLALAVVVFGGVPGGIGWVLFLIGRKLRRG